jgi:hypothetical protein
VYRSLWRTWQILELAGAETAEHGFHTMLSALTFAKPRFLAKKRPSRLPALQSRYFSLSQLGSMPHEINEPIEEELLPSNRLRFFHPTHSGEVLNGSFKTIAKLGFGAGSTVWLTEDLRLYAFPHNWSSYLLTFT